MYLMSGARDFCGSGGGGGDGGPHATDTSRWVRARKQLTKVLGLESAVVDRLEAVARLSGEATGAAARLRSLVHQVFHRRARCLSVCEPSLERTVCPTPASFKE